MGSDLILLYVVFLVIPAIFIAYIARKLGYNAFVWLAFSLFATWPIALVLLLVLDDFEKVVVRRMRSKQTTGSGPASTSIPEIEKSVRYPEGSESQGIEVYVFNGKEYPARDVAENARDLYIADLRARSAGD